MVRFLLALDVNGYELPAFTRRPFVITFSLVNDLKCKTNKMSKDVRDLRDYYAYLTYFTDEEVRIRHLARLVQLLDRIDSGTFFFF